MSRFAPRAPGRRIAVIGSGAAGLAAAWYPESIGDSYAPTLAEWRRRFLAAARRIRGQGYPPEFLRKWVYYFSYCEAGFRGGALDDLQFVLRRPDRGAPGEESRARVV